MHWAQTTKFTSQSCFVGVRRCEPTRFSCVRRAPRDGSVGPTSFTLVNERPRRSRARRTRGGRRRRRWALLCALRDGCEPRPSRTLLPGHTPNTMRKHLFHERRKRWEDYFAPPPPPPSPPPKPPSPPPRVRSAPVLPRPPRPAHRPAPTRPRLTPTKAKQVVLDGPPAKMAWAQPEPRPTLGQARIAPDWPNWRLSMYEATPGVRYRDLVGAYERMGGEHASWLEAACNLNTPVDEHDWKQTMHYRLRVGQLVKAASRGSFDASKSRPSEAGPRDPWDHSGGAHYQRLSFLYG